MDEYRPSARMMFCVTFLFWFSQYAYVPYLNPELQAMGATATFMGMVSAGYGFTQLLSRIPMGIAADRWHCHKLFVAAGCLMSVIASFGMYFFYSPAGFLIFRAAGGLGAASWVAFTVLYSGYFAASKAPQAISMLNVANQAGRLVCFVLVTLLVGRFGVRGCFLLSGFTALLALALCLGLREAPAAGQPIQLRQLPALLRDRTLLVCSLLAILAQTVAFSTYSAFVSNHAAAIGAQSAQLSGMNIALMAPVVLAGYLVARRWLPRYGLRPLLLCGFSVTALYCLLLPASARMSEVYALQALAGVGNSLTVAVLLGGCVQNIPPRSRATAMGFFQAVYGIGMTGGPVLMGSLTDRFGLHIAFWAMGGVSLLALALTFCLLPGQAKKDTAGR